MYIIACKLTFFERIDLNVSTFIDYSWTRVKSFVRRHELILLKCEDYSYNSGLLLLIGWREATSRCTWYRLAFNLNQRLIITIISCFWWWRFAGEWEDRNTWSTFHAQHNISLNPRFPSASIIILYNPDSSVRLCYSK